MKVYLIRHGLTDAIVSGLYCGSTNVSVNSKGLSLLKQSAASNLYPAKNSISLFAASTLSRTAQTLREIYGNDITVITSERFNELDFGAYEMKTDAQLQGNPEYCVWIDQHIHQGPPHGESIDELWLRMVAGFEELYKTDKNTGDVLLVSHGISIATVLFQLFGYPLLLSVPQPGEGYAVELGFDVAGKFLPSGAKFLSRICDMGKHTNLWEKPKNFSCFTNKKSELTILHTNDLHGQFLFKATPDCTMRGGFSLLSGYLKKVKEENPNVLFVISGDLTEKGLMEQTVKGINASDIFNYLSPDLMAIGNHELNYGLSQLLLFEKCVNFPIVNANLYTRNLQRPLLQPYFIKTVNGIRFMFIGIFDEAMFRKMPVTDFEQESLEYKESLSQIIQICALYKTPDIDMVILLTHLGLHQDRKLAKSIPKECGIRIILGGHSHIRMTEPVVENDIFIVQSAYGTEYLGRLDMVFDHQKQDIAQLDWKLVSIDSEACDSDGAFDAISDRLLESRCAGKRDVLCTFAQPFLHEKRYESTPLGNLFSDAFLDIYAVDIVWFPSKSIRTESCGPSVTYMNLLQTLPYDGGFVCIELSGAKIAQLLAYNFPDIPQDQMLIPLQYSRGFELVYDCKSCKTKVSFCDNELSKQQKTYVLGMPAYTYDRFFSYFGEQPDDVLFKKRVLSNSMLTDLVNYFKSSKQSVVADVNPRMIYLNREWRKWEN